MGGGPPGVGDYLLESLYGTVADQAEVSPDSKPWAKPAAVTPRPKTPQLRKGNSYSATDPLSRRV